MTPLINGINYSWSNITLVLFGQPVRGVTAISYKAKQKKENNYGSGVDPISRGYSNVEYEASITLYLDEWKNIITASGGNPLALPPFPIQIVYGKSRAVAQTDTLLEAEFMEDPMSSQQGDSKVTIEIPLIIAGIAHT